jgi:hypothetical protein
MSPANFKLWAVDDKIFIVDRNFVNYDIGTLTTVYLSALIMAAILSFPLFSTIYGTFL